MNNYINDLEKRCEELQDIVSAAAGWIPVWINDPVKTNIHWYESPTITFGCVIELFENKKKLYVAVILNNFIGGVHCSSVIEAKECIEHVIKVEQKLINRRVVSSSHSGSSSSSRS